MGVFSFLASSFMGGWRSGQQGAACKAPLQSVPHTPHLFYPAILPRFDEIARGGHVDPRALAELHTIQELKDLLRQRGLPVGGNKPVLSKRLADSGFKIVVRDYRYRFWELSENGVGKIEESRSDEKQAFFLAVHALKELDYSGAISVYRSFDDKKRCQHFCPPTLWPGLRPHQRLRYRLVPGQGATENSAQGRYH